MDQVLDEAARKREHLERLFGALDEGLFVVNAKGEVLCVLQDVTESRGSRNGLVAAIEAVIADASAFGSSIMEKFTALRNGGCTNGHALELDGLTEREREVLGLICQGQDDSQMSKTLGLSRNTVRNHIAALYRKIGVNRRGAAMIWARERGITSEEALKPRVRRRLRSTRH